MIEATINRASGGAPAGGAGAKTAVKPVMKAVGASNAGPVVKKKSMSKRIRETADTLAAKQKDISVSEFFAKNRHLLGFDNPSKALLTTIKEAVDNSLDACEEAGILPELVIEVHDLGLEQTGQLTKGEGRFLVVVQDNGMPGMSATQSFHAIVLPLPQLNIAWRSNAAELTWPAVYADYVLQHATNLNSPVTWMDAANTVATVGTNKVVFDDPPGAREQYYRLRSP